MLINWFKLISPKNRILKRATIAAKQVDLLKDEMRALSDEQLFNKTDYFINELQNNNKTTDDILVEAFAVIREAVYRETGNFAYLVQLIGAYVVHQGDFSEMMTGEGKTLTLVLAAYLNMLEKKGVHIVTVNEYLAERDAEQARKIFARLNMTVGCNKSNLAPHLKKEAFDCDLTYTTNSELGFDYLRDNMVHNYKDKKIRGLHFAIVDEGDSILIDEARTPLIISGQPKKDFKLYFEADKFVDSLTDDDYKVDLEARSPSLTEKGIDKAEKFFKIKNLFDLQNSDLYHKIGNALMAKKVFENGKEYIVRDDKILIVDHFTGRILEGRSYNGGLHQAVQAKERVPIEPENIIVATVTYQSFFRLYKKLAAVSGTALTEAEEFLKIYNMVVVPVPTNRPIIRKDYPDYIFGNLKTKWEAVVAEIEKIHKTGQPILVGTGSVEDSELLHEMLLEKNIIHEVLNAKNHAREAQIVAKAGEVGSVTISTNMAGRGTDIKLGQGAKELGGLYVIGTERHESRRIDNQLRGRSGRQGDIGASRFFISFADPLFKRFAQDRILKAQQKLASDYFDSKFFSRFLSMTQKKVESVNFDMRKNLIDYDHVLANQRELVYKQRDKILLANDLTEVIQKMAANFVEGFVETFKDQANQTMVNPVELALATQKQLLKDEEVSASVFYNQTLTAAKETLLKLLKQALDKKITTMTPMIANNVFKDIIVRQIDDAWINHLDQMHKLREGVSLRSLEQTSPLNIYVEEGKKLFDSMLNKIADGVILAVASIVNPSENVEINTEQEHRRLEALKRLEEIKKIEAMQSQANDAEHKIKLAFPDQDGNVVEKEINVQNLVELADVKLEENNNNQDQQNN
ncbi:preprotein translocase subunit SecA [Mycoplasma sp. E35C]|uniref:preprotein translocase subunit SecA n=1 Tax=Mycoplasma sp. E35C TaxID=2801918 RepID=UPI001CA423B6|nr:preprotein translocase subunit SecA [Mycoplasma sp. E35C]QZX49172.1 preprotein translocase subunit SecA [Mycoplasma sp. E35C]